MDIIGRMSTITVSDLVHLSISERLKLVEDLWDSIAADAASHPDHLPVTAAQREILRQRQQSYRDDPSRVLSSEEVFERIERDLE